jgi:hypothetical protein
MEKRRTTRNPLWKSTLASVRFMDALDSKQRNVTTVRGRVDNMGSTGLFLVTKNHVPHGTDLDIFIEFSADDPTSPMLEARGRVIRTEERGVAIKFSAIDVRRFGECVITMLNRDQI